MRLLTVEDGFALFYAVDAARRDLARWFEWPDRVTSILTASEYIAEIQHCSRIKLWWLIYANGFPVGGIQLRVRDGGASVSLPYWLVPSARGNGIATESVRKALGIAGSIGFKKAKFVIATDNIGSRNLALRLGFSPVGEPSESLLRGRAQMSQAYELSLACG